MFNIDRLWHHFCVTWNTLNGTWALYADGQMKATSTNIYAFHEIMKGGIFIVGQDQDTFGGSFKQKDSFSGNITYLNIWRKVLNDDEIEQVRSCSLSEKYIVFGWNTHKLEKETALQEFDIPVACP
ncbi:adhesion G- coupled receptor D2, partial [Pelobates cultripes]